MENLGALMSKYVYNPNFIESKWQKFWEDEKIFITPTELEKINEKPKMYILDMFPYPSGEGLHVGHAKGYTASDVLSRFWRMRGVNVLHPMGWDSFGLPAERAAEREGIHPAEITERNVNNFRRQMKRIGLSYDWSREIDTSRPEYYKWTQWIFLKLYEKGLAYIADVPVNWCPALSTVLSNEEVYDGKYIETGDIVEKRIMRQWMLKITSYAERLLNDLEGLDWPDSIKELQRNWIGKSVGVNIEFSIKNQEEKFIVFTTRPETIFGVTFCVLSPDHPLLDKIIEKEQLVTVQRYIQDTVSKTNKQRLISSEEATGVFTGSYAINPVNNEEIPIWISDYVLNLYGTGAVMAVPAHDSRDFNFAKKNNLPILQVIKDDNDEEDVKYRSEKGICVNSGFLDGLSIEQARKKIIDWLKVEKKGVQTTQYRLRDWLFSRQRYWGEPFPIVHFQDGTIKTIPPDQLPVTLPEKLEIKFKGGALPLNRASDEWLMVEFPDGKIGFRETNTMPQWAGSCWYYLRFLDPHNNNEPWDSRLEKYWMPVDIYIGGIEHAVLHLLYSRFWHKVLYDCGLVSTNEPFKKLFNQGLLLAQSFQDERGKYYYANQVEKFNNNWVVKNTKEPVKTKMDKMSKSKLNVVSLDDVVNKYGADSLRLYELFIGPMSAGGPWQMDGIDGIYRFLQKVWRIFVDERTGELDKRIVNCQDSEDPELGKELYKSLKIITDKIIDIDKMNVAVSQLMILSTQLQKRQKVPIGIAKQFVKLLSPFAPHISEEIWQKLGEKGTILKASWPIENSDMLIEHAVKIAIQVDGKFRSVIEIPLNCSEKTIIEKALQDEVIVRFVQQKDILNTFVVDKKIVNFVTK